ncbi:hypothetical protein F2Q69_00006654 [Brassica cretica]|uniref:Uncharacterized protein n=1 Tax=Brassica cretica TaxID=69181 RepID=A0A8S9NW12_BRACR|nr:hypothetical protein F2Q69_00006654 [Brassica cretica]
MLRQDLEDMLQGRESKSTRLEEREIGSAISPSNGFESLRRIIQVKHDGAIDSLHRVEILEIVDRSRRARKAER